MNFILLEAAPLHDAGPPNNTISPKLLSNTFPINWTEIKVNLVSHNG